MIIPAVIPKSLEQLARDLATLSFQKNLQIDVVDGRFTPFVSWPYEPKGEVRDAKALLQPFSFEVDLMVLDSITAGEAWIEAGARRLIFHLESLANPEEAIALAKKHDIEIGLALLNDTPLAALSPYIKDINFVQLMGIAKIGAQGEPFDERVLPRVTELRKQYPELTISIDGAVGKENIAALNHSGANHFVVGSEILEDMDREAEYRDLLALIGEQ